MSQNKMKIVFAFLFLSTTSFEVFADTIFDANLASISDEIEKVFKNISRAFWVDNVAYSLTEAEHLVFLYYESVASRRLATIPAFQQLVQADDTSNQTTTTRDEDSLKGIVAIEKHLWNIRKNNTRSKINRLLFNKIQLDAKIVGIPKDCSRMVICKEDINAILM